ncbi:hypothetical protein [Achromobacter sp. 2789STDY5608621]|uniref:hypothetical protein n=1 Tax=Achromobacter sp. 2789STDY5608621 TaxID=1806496 RepID=UPI0006C8D6CC|nr:hypothetical protein [Achromobacter sp. 2789STDY5608621]
MTNQNNAAQAAEPQTVLSFDERERILCQFMREPINHDREMAIAIESAVLSKLRAPVADERAAVDPCGYVAVKVSAVDWLKDKFPALTIKAGLCERIGGRLYTITRLMRDHDAALASAPVAPAEVMDALNWVDDFIARCNRDDRGSCESVNVLRRALASAPVADGWQPIDTAPAGQRVLLGPRRAPVVGIVKHYEDPDSDKPAIVCNVVHYNDTVLVADYHCSEWAPLASAPVAGEAREHIEQRAVNRYRPVPDGKLSYKVVAGDGTRSLYTGTKDSCLRVAAKLTEAFLDGAFVASDAAPQASAEPAQPCSCPSGDGSLRHPCAVHQASEAVRDAGIAASEDVVLPPLPEALALQPGQLGHTDQTLDYFARAAVLADRQQRADRSQVARNECDCATCRPHSVEMRMILCSICGDKRCPHAADHRNACTATQPEQGERDA